MSGAAMTDPLVEIDWLASNLDRVKVLDATYVMPPDPTAVCRMFEQGHIPGARLFEIDRVADHASGLPHMLPSAADLAEALGRLGIGSKDTVVVYDRSSNHFSAPRVWKTLRAYGHDRCFVLNGGFQAWFAAGNTSESLRRDVEPVAYVPATLLPRGFLSLAEMARLTQAGARGTQIVDARSSGRFQGTSPEPRAGLRSGHMPGARNLPFDALTMADGRFADAPTIRMLLERAEVRPGDPAVATCGSGMTACVLALAFARVGSDAAVYDGSWMEWGGHTDTPVMQGPAG